MRQFTHDFSLLDRHTWLNVASQGPLPKVADKALQEAVLWKSAPHQLTIPKFQQVPLALKACIGALLNVDKADVILGNSATYGLHLLSHGLDFKPGDEVILLQNDFPSDILPWLSLRQKGVMAHQLKAQEHVLTVEELDLAVTSRTRLVCLPYVHSFSGFKHDITAIGKWCRSHGIIFIVNISQAAGAFELDLSRWEVDAVVCAGYKWLLGPYGTGFCWIKKALREQLNYAQNYWVSLMDEASLNSDGPIQLNEDRSARRYDVFGTANFFNFVPWEASIKYLMSIGLKGVEKHNQALVDQLIQGIDPGRFKLISPRALEQRSNIVVFSSNDPLRNARLNDYLKNKGYYLALWKNNLRVSPHIYNTPRELEGFLKELDGYVP